MAQKPEDQPQILAKETQSFLLQLASKDVDISEETFPKDLVIKVEVSFQDCTEDYSYIKFATLLL